MSSKKSSSPISKVAVFSLIYGLLAIPVIGTFFASLAVVFGHVGLAKCRKTSWNPKPLRGRRAAQIGLILGYLSLFTTPLILIGVGAVGFNRKDEVKALATEIYRNIDSRFLEERQHRSFDSAARLYLACETYASTNNEQYPGSWTDLVGRYLTRNDLARLLKSSHPEGPEESFRIIPHERPVLAPIMDTVVVIQEIAPPSVESVVVVYADGNTDLIENPDID